MRIRGRAVPWPRRGVLRLTFGVLRFTFGVSRFAFRVSFRVSRFTFGVAFLILWAGGTGTGCDYLSDVHVHFEKSTCAMKVFDLVACSSRSLLGRRPGSQDPKV